MVDIEGLAPWWSGQLAAALRSRTWDWGSEQRKAMVVFLFEGVHACSSGGESQGRARKTERGLDGARLTDQMAEI